MRYFAYLAEQAFHKSPDGTRLFYRNGPWSRPYVVPDQTTEKRLFDKQLSIMRLLVGGLILGQPFLFIQFPELVSKPIWFIWYLFLVTVATWLVSHFVFRNDLADLERTASRTPLRSFFAGFAEKHSTSTLALGLVGSISFDLLGLWMLADGQRDVIAWMCLGSFTLCTVAWGYALCLKCVDHAEAAAP